MRDGEVYKSQIYLEQIWKFFTEVITVFKQYIIENFLMIFVFCGLSSDRNDHNHYHDDDNRELTKIISKELMGTINTIQNSTTACLTLPYSRFPPPFIKTRVGRNETRKTVLQFERCKSSGQTTTNKFFKWFTSNSNKINESSRIEDQGTN